MAIAVKETAHVATGIALLIEQFKKRQNIEGVLSSYLKECQAIEEFFWDIIDKRVLDDAVDDQLDQLGGLVKEQRLDRSNDEYRAAIRIRIRVYKSRGRITDLIDIATMADPGGTPVVTEYRYSGFEIEIYGQPGERYVAELLNEARGATSYGILNASGLMNNGLEFWDDAAVPDVSIETFEDVGDM